MMRRARLPLAVATLALLISCQSDNLTRTIDGPMYAVSDGAHDGNPDFFFLSPLFQNPSNDPNYEPAAFNGALRPAVEICELGAPAPDNTRECVAGDPIKRFAPGSVNVSTTDQLYHVNWNTDESNLVVTSYYRIRVLVGPTELGFADIDPVSSGKDLKNLQTGEYIGLVDGRTLPIKFRIESGALCSTDGTPCASETITLTQGGGIELVVPGEDFHFDVRAGTQATSNGQPVTEVTFNLETCDGVDVDLPKVGECLRVTALYDAAGTALNLSLPILISMCSYGVINEGQQELITLHQQDGDLIRALPHAQPNCDVIGARTVESSNVAVRGVSWLRDLAVKVFTPQKLYASTRTAVLHLGGGGETSRLGATCTPPASAKLPVGMALGECTPAVAQVTPFPSGGRTISDFQFALPAKMDYVDPDDASRSAPAGTSLATAVKVTDWNDAPVQGATVTFTIPVIEGPAIVIGTAVSNADGIAQVSWPIVAGNNTLIASGRGIAAQNNYPDATVKPFMPDIFSTAPQTPVILGTGEITFQATGTLPDLVVDSFAQSPAAPTTADLITFVMVIRNVGDAPAGPSTAGIDVGGEPAPGQTYAVPALAPGATFQIQRQMVLDVAQGYLNFARADVNNDVAESNEGNNERSLAFVVTAPVLDQQNLLDGSLGGQGIGRFNQANGAPDPSGTSFDFQDAQTFTAGTSGRLVMIKVPLINTGLSTTGVTMEILAVTGAAPDNATSFGQVTIPASAISSDVADVDNPAAWATFNLTSLGINVTAGQAYSYVVRTTSTIAYLYNPESTLGYANGSGFRRNFALGATWNAFQDFGFQTFVAP